VHLDVLRQLGRAAGAGLLRRHQRAGGEWSVRTHRDTQHSSTAAQQHHTPHTTHLLIAAQLLAPLLAIQAQAAEGHAITLNCVRIHSLLRHPRLDSCIQCGERRGALCE
jgi:hypothetical protein